MKLKFKTQDFQTDAVNAVCDLFAGQEKSRATFSIVEDAQMSMMQNELGVGNALLIDDDTLLKNMQAVQRRNHLQMTKGDWKGGFSFPISFPMSIPARQTPQFCVEMETGTGKTYVYTKSIFEMNRRYGFTKFIIVVPSVAIREGVYKSFQITADHFGAHYDNVPCRYFIYDSKKLSDVRQFATSGNIEIMIINIDAFKKAENIINQVQDKLNGETAMRFIQDTNPIVIIDEPQSVDNTPKAKEAIASMNPLCVFRYSATHREKINLLYRLTPVDAYQMGLVKQICVSSNAIEGDYNKPYIALKSVSNENGFRAKFEIDVQAKSGQVNRKTITAKPGDDLFILSGRRELYDGYQLAGIDCTPGGECVEFSNTEVVKLGKAIGSVDENILKRAQIRRTIEAHLDKELRYLEKGIKVLSLFFIDEVVKYRTTEGDKGIYAEMFEECYLELLDKPKYAELKSRFVANVESVHNGYFSQDKKGAYKNTKGDTLADDDTYNTIMRDKEWLLSFECPLRFIFSHSALKEGWDNPNVFQVCTLIEQKSAFTCRQKVGRGLRLCVDQQGNRIEDRDVNILHVMANESFAEFADTLQREIEQETGVKFGVLQLSLFVGQTYEETKIIEKKVSDAQASEVVDVLKSNGVIDSSGTISSTFSDEEIVDLLAEQVPAIPASARNVVAAVIGNAFEAASDESDNITKSVKIDAEVIRSVPYTETITEEKVISYEDAATLMTELEDKKLITKDGKMKDTMKAQLAAGTLDLGARFSQAAQRAIVQAIEKADARPPLRDASREVTVRRKERALLSPQFEALWDQIKQKTTYRVQINQEALIENSVHDLRAMPPIPRARLVSQTADIDIQSAGVSHTERELRTTDLQDTYDTLPDILRVITTETQLKRSTVGRIIKDSDRGKDFLNNPQAFTEKALEIITRNRHNLAIDGIRYVKLAGEEYYVQEIFDSAELIANLDRNAVAVDNSVYDHIIYDSLVESRFAESLDNDPDVKMFFKIPSRFKIETPIGTYNPDWAVYLKRNGEQKLYFVLETKGTTDLFGLSNPERQKIHCGKAHFDALENDVVFSELPVRDWREFKRNLQ
ncbi:DEAD/DEAH box helicase family protein [Ruminococcaceae bacterium OttesenSCG-928-D13]|nr:DEAD/DEAH box helicase family protein [Ruminococcaceae bacterium OttesenSCG-928-D13]